MRNLFQFAYSLAKVLSKRLYLAPPIACLFVVYAPISQAVPSYSYTTQAEALSACSRTISGIQGAYGGAANGHPGTPIILSLSCDFTAGYFVGYYNWYTLKYSYLYDDGHTENGEQWYLYPGNDRKNTGNGGGCDGGEGGNDRCAKQQGSPIAGNPINPATGNKYNEELDFSDDQWLVFRRFYNSDSSVSKSTLGERWRHSFDRTLTIYKISNQPSTLTFFRPDGKTETFRKSGSQWITDPDVIDTVGEVADAQGVLSAYKLFVASKDRFELYSLAGKLIRVEDRNGLGINLTYSDAQTNPLIAPQAGLLISVINSQGRGINFTYDSSSRLRQLTVPDGGITTYSYDSANDLKEVQYADGEIRAYLYNEPALTGTANLPHYLTAIIDENNNRYKEVTYDSRGRATETRRIGGVDAVSVTYNANGSSTVQYASGISTTLGFSTSNHLKKLASSSQPCSPACDNPWAARTYDSYGFPFLHTDFLGKKTKTVYNSKGLLEQKVEAVDTTSQRITNTSWDANLRKPLVRTFLNSQNQAIKKQQWIYNTRGQILANCEINPILAPSYVCSATGTPPTGVRRWAYTYCDTINSQCPLIGLLLATDGPRTDVNDFTTYTYYTSASNTVGSVHSIGDLATVTNALGHVTSITNYDLNGRPLSITDANGIVTTLTYTPRGWLKTKTVNGAQTTTYDYDGVGQLIQVTLPDNSALKYTYDTAHRLTDIQDGYVSGGALVLSGNKIHYTLDAMGNRTKEDTQDPSNAILKTRSRVFDALNRLQKDIGGTSPSTQITQYGYDNNGNLKTVTDANSGVTTNGYDALNRLITVTDPASGVSTTSYDARDQITQVKDPRLVTTNYTVDALGNVTLTQSPDSGNTTNVHDAAGNIIQKTDARGVVSNYSYDALNRLTSIEYPSDPSTSVYFYYDNPYFYYSRGRLAIIEYGNTGSTMALTYDAYGNLKSQNDWVTFSNGGDIQFASSYMYDAANRVQRITYGPTARRTIYTRNALGQITQVQTQDNASAPLQTIVSSISYEPFGPMKSLTFGNGVTTTIAHDSDYQVARITTTSTPAWDYVYGYDPVGNILSQTDQITTANKVFDYDSLNRVTGDSFGGVPYGYQYDTGGNRIAGGFAFLPYSQSYAANSNRLTTLSSTTMPSDAAGNLLKDSGGGTLTYNAANQLTQWSKSGATTTTYQYNGLGWRNAKLGSSSIHYDYTPDGKLLAQVKLNTDNTFNEIVEYLWLDDLPIAQIKTTYAANNAVSARRLTYIHADHLNTARIMTDTNKTVVWKWHADAYGMVAPNANPDGDSVTDTLDLRFPGQIADSESGLYYNMNRYYDPLIGRYTQSDPIGPTRDYSNPVLQTAMRAGVPLNKGQQRNFLRGLNQPYAYAENNPVKFTDPFGLECYATMNMGTPGYVCNSGSPYPSSYSHQGENSSGVSEMTPIDNRSAAQSECDACKFTCNVATALGPGPIFPRTFMELVGAGASYAGNSLICAQMCKKECSQCK